MTDDAHKHVDPELPEQDDEEVVCDDEKEPEYYLWRVERLLELDQRHELPRIEIKFGTLMFEDLPPAKTGLSISKEKFLSRLSFFMSIVDPSMPPLTVDLSDYLFNSALKTHECINLWQRLLNQATGSRLEAATRRVRKELGRFEAIRHLLTQNLGARPDWMEPWAECWMGALEEIQAEMEGSLRGALSTLEAMRDMKRFKSSEIESQMIWLEKENIKKQIKVTRFDRKLEVIVAGFAYAASLVPMKPGADLSGFVSVVKQRSSRISTQKAKQLAALSSRLQALITSTQIART